MKKFLKISSLILTFLLVFSAPILAQNLFIDMIERFRSSGIFDIFLFILFFIALYAILMKSKVLGTNAGLNGTVALIAAFLISLYSTFTGFSLTEPLSRFFTQASIVGLIFIAALVMVSVFYPDLPKMLSEHFKGPTMLYIMIPLALALLITSRSIWVLWAGYKTVPGPSTDITILIVGLLIFVVILLIAAAIARGGKS
jgi:hypothetical protein